MRAWILGLLLVVAAPGFTQEVRSGGGSVRVLPDSRSFAMGYTAFPYDLTLEAVEETYEFVARNGDLIAFHHDGGVPWPEALAGGPYHPNLLAEIDDEIAHILPDQVVYVSATCQSTSRSGDLAPYWAEDRMMPLPPGWEDRTLDDPEVIAAYTNWCRFLLDRFEPDYFVFAIECNGGFRGLDDPSLSQFLALAGQVYPRLKAEYPGTPILVSVQTGSTESRRGEFLELTRRILHHSDMVGISSYPYLVLRYGGWDAYTDPDDLPEDLLTSITDLAPGKPVAITETGYIAEDLDIDAFNMHIEGRRGWQTKYVWRLMEEASALNAEFVVWFVPWDYDMLLQTLEDLGLPIDPSFLIWRDNGMRDGAGRDRPSLSAWRRWLALPRE